jgi:archaetidylinositol phosphate synthase
VREQGNSAHSQFTEATRTQVSLLANIERKFLLWLADRLPRWVTPDHLTFLGLVSAIGIGVCYYLYPLDRRFLLCASLLLAVNWFGDSLDGTLARVRRRERPRYGFYIDHLVDSLAALFLMAGLGFSGLMSRAIAAGLLTAFLMLSVEVYLATYTVGNFEISHWKLSPTEIRIMLAAFNVVVYWHPVALIEGHSYRLFDMLGLVGIACGGGMLLLAVARNVAALHRIDPPR